MISSVVEGQFLGMNADKMPKKNCLFYIGDYNVTLFFKTLRSMVKQARIVLELPHDVCVGSCSSSSYCRYPELDLWTQLDLFRFPTRCFASSPESFCLDLTLGCVTISDDFTMFQALLLVLFQRLQPSRDQKPVWPRLRAPLCLHLTCLGQYWAVFL